MAPKKDTPDKGTEIVFEPLAYLTYEAATSINLLESKEYDIILRALGTINKYATDDDNFINYLFVNGIFNKLVQLLSHEDLYIQRFTLKLIAEFARRENYFPKLLFLDLFDCYQKVLKYFMEGEDSVIIEFSALILLKLIQYSGAIKVYLFSEATINRIFDILKATPEPDIQSNTYQMFFNVIDVEQAEDELLATQGFSIPALFCLYKCEIEEIRDLTMDVFHKMVSWKKEELLIALSKQKINEVMVKTIIADESQKYYDKAFFIIITCISQEEIATEFAKSLEFLLFTEWVKICPPNAVIPSSTILTILTRIAELRQLLFDLSVEDTIIFLLRYEHESIIVNACEAITNMSNHKFCCEKMMTPGILLTLINIVKNNEFSLMPCRERALTTIYDFLKRNDKTLKVLIECKGFLAILVLFESYEDKLSGPAYSMVLEIMQMCSGSKYCDQLTSLGVYFTLLNLYKNKRHLLEVLDTMNGLVPNEEFRGYFVELNGTQLFMMGLCSTSSSAVFEQMLLVIQNMVMYQNIALEFLDEGLLAFLKSIDPDIKRKISTIDSICETLYDFYLPLKFFDKNRLEIHNKLRDYFFLLHDDWFVNTANTKTILDQDISSSKAPIYVVNYTILQDVYNKPPSESSDSCSSDSDKYIRRFARQSGDLSVSSLKEQYLCDLGQVAPDYVKCRPKEAPVNYGNLSDDPYLAQYIRELYDELFFNETDTTTLQQKVQHVATFVDKQLSGFEATDDNKRKKHLFDVHINELKTKLGTNLIPIGFLRTGYCCERAILFKALADNLGIPATLCRNKNSAYWNEIAIVRSAVTNKKNILSQPTNNLIFFVVDLMDNIGNLMPVGSAEADEYCRLTM